MEVLLAEFSLDPTILLSGPGETEFFVTNQGAIEHQLVVIRTDQAPSDLAVVDGKVDEAQAGPVMGEIETDVLQPGQSGFMSLDLEAGTYVLICNIAGHYEAGMRAGITLTD